MSLRSPGHSHGGVEIGQRWQHFLPEPGHGLSDIRSWFSPTLISCRWPARSSCLSSRAGLGSRAVVQSPFSCRKIAPAGLRGNRAKSARGERAGRNARSQEERKTVLCPISYGTEAIVSRLTAAFERNRANRIFSLSQRSSVALAVALSVSSACLRRSVRIRSSSSASRSDTAR